jgi:hypothetical protein
MSSVTQTQGTATSIERIIPRRTGVGHLMPGPRTTAELLGAEFVEVKP